MLEETSNRTEARSVGEEVGVEHHLQSDFDFRHDADSIATDSSGGYLLEYVEVLSRLRQGEGRRFVDNLPSIFQRAEFAFFTFREVLKYRKH